MELNDSLLKLDVTLYGNAEPLTDTLSKCRVRIFYKGLNRNRTFISDDFANQLIASLPYAPIKGIFDKEELDFGDHGEKNSDGRIYGLVAANPNFAWERHIDTDGVEREYACADVILYTALYPEAKFIPGKSQSMEIHRNGLEGEWKVWDEDQRPYFHFLTGHLLGLQTLGDEVEPCFEGSAFYSLNTKELVEYAKKSNKKEESKMEKNIFKLSDNDSCNLLFDALNSAENSCKIVCDICDEYTIAYDTAEQKYIYAYYTKDNETNTISIDRVEDCYMINVNAADKAAIDAINAIGSYSEIQAKIEEQAAQIEAFTTDKNSLTEQLSAALAKVEEYENKENSSEEPEFEKKEEEKKEDGEDKKEDDKEKNSLNTEIQEEINSYKAQIAEKDAEIARLNQLNSDITNEKSELESYKKSVDTEKKTSIINEFASHLTEEQIADFTARQDDFTVEDFKKEVCYAAYNSNSSILSTKDKEEPDLIYKNTHKDMDMGALKLLRKHKGGNK